MPPPNPLVEPPPPPAAAAAEILAALWHEAGLPAAGLRQIQLGDDPSAVLPSSFRVAVAAQCSLAAAALAAAEVWQWRHAGQPRQQVAVDRRHAVVESSGYFRLDGRIPEIWDKLSGLYRCGSEVPSAATGWVRIHANFAHHRDGVLRLLGLPEGEQTPRTAVANALREWPPLAFEQAAADAGMVVAAARSFADWDAHPQSHALAAQPVVAIERIGNAPPIPWPSVSPKQPPLHGLRVLDLTRILAGPVAGRCLAGYGADVLLVNSPRLPNIAAIADTSRGKLSCLVDLDDADGPALLDGLTASAHVFLQGYRPGGLRRRGYGAERLAQLRPGIVVAELSAYGWTGPWAGRRGFDSLVQTACGFNLAEADAAGSDVPQAMPLQILDYSAGYLLALGIQAALWRQVNQGGSWRVRVSLAGVGQWLRSLGRQVDGLSTPPLPETDLAPWLDRCASGFGDLQSVQHAARFSRTASQPRRPSMPPGSHPPQWPAP